MGKEQKFTCPYFGGSEKNCGRCVTNYPPEREAQHKKDIADATSKDPRRNGRGQRAVRDTIKFVTGANRLARKLGFELSACLKLERMRKGKIP